MKELLQKEVASSGYESNGKHRKVIAAETVKEYPIQGIPEDAVVAVPKVDVVGRYARKYESRTYAHKGVVIISRQRPAEVAVNSVLRPNTDIIEVGDYPEGDYDLINRIEDKEQTPRVNGVPVEANKTQTIVNRIRQRGAKVMATHEQDARLVKLANEWGIAYPENFDVFRELTCKSGLNKALDEYQRNHTNSHIGPFGKNFENRGELMDEVTRLADYGQGAYIKFDFAPQGQVNAGGEGQLALPKDVRKDERYNKLSAFINEGQYGIQTPLSGVVQLMVPNPTILSMSSGQDAQGNYQTYEAHEQTQDGNTAAGAKPLKDNFYTEVLFHKVWPDMIRFFEESSITGRQNMNYICIPPDLLELSRFLYNNPNLQPVTGIDLNYRAISGTLNAMARYQEETGRKMNFQKFRSHGIKVHPFYAANPHLIYASGKELGLYAGNGGNFSVINMGTFEPDQLDQQPYFKTQVIANDMDNPEEKISTLEDRLHDSPSSQTKKMFNENGIEHISPQRATSLNEDSYAIFIKTNLKKVLTTHNI